MTSSPMPAAHCSNAGCTEPATYRIAWRNPRIHSADRRKIWLACDQHRDHLSEFLRARAFPVAVETIEFDVAE